MPNQTRIRVGNITYHRRGSMSGQCVSSLHQNPEIFIHYFFFLGNSASQLIEMIMA